MGYSIHNSEVVAWCAEELQRIEAGAPRYHAVLCDPPYGIAFMGKEWDDVGGPQAFQATAKSWGEAIKPLLHPGALVFMFAGTRMWHRLAAGMEDAGFHLWDTLMWLHGQGFPKGQDISKLIDKAQGNAREVVGVRTDGSGSGSAVGMGSNKSMETEFSVTAPGSEVSSPWAGHKTPQLKPAWEPVLCFRAPNQGKKYAELALQHGSGALNVDGARIETCAESFSDSRQEKANDVYGKYNPADYDGSKGRYPANLALDEETAPMLDEQSGITTSRGGTPKNLGNDRLPWTGSIGPTTGGLGDSGGASRFFYVAKASRSEREAGLDSFAKKPTAFSNGANVALSKGEDYTEAQGVGLNVIKHRANPHPTVKPIKLCEWLASLLLPPDSVKPRRILVPFSGSGSEMIGCALAGWDDITGVEISPEYCEIANARLDFRLPNL
jgi:DNA methylase